MPRFLDVSMHASSPAGSEPAAAGGGGGGGGEGKGAGGGGAMPWQKLRGLVATAVVVADVALQQCSILGSSVGPLILLVCLRMWL